MKPCCCPREVTDALHLEEEKGGDSRGERGRCPRQREPRIHRPPPLRGCLCGKGLHVFAATWSLSCGSALHVFPSQSLPASQEVGTLSAHLAGRTLRLRDVSCLASSYSVPALHSAYCALSQGASWTHTPECPRMAGVSHLHLGRVTKGNSPGCVSVCVRGEKVAGGSLETPALQPFVNLFSL